MSLTDGKLCDICEIRPAVESDSRMDLCKECADEQRQVIADIKLARDVSTAKASIEHAQKYDQSLTVRTDIFNSETASITELRGLIEADARIDNKEYRLHEVVQEKINHFKKVIFEKQAEIVDINNRIRANQQFLVENANKLRTDEREKLKLQDITYKPGEVKIGKPKLVSVKKKLDKALVKDLVNKLNAEFPAFKLAESTFYTVMTVKGRGPEDTYYDMRKSLKEGMSANSTN